MGVVELYNGEVSYDKWLETHDKEGHVLGVTKPLRKWEEYKLSRWQKFLLIFLSEDEKKEVLKRVDNINRGRKKDAEEKFVVSKPSIRIPSQAPPPRKKSYELELAKQLYENGLISKKKYKKVKNA